MRIESFYDTVPELQYALNQIWWTQPLKDTDLSVTIIINFVTTNVAIY